MSNNTNFKYPMDNKTHLTFEIGHLAFDIDYI